MRVLIFIVFLIVAALFSKGIEKVAGMKRKIIIEWLLPPLSFVRTRMGNMY